MKLQYLSNTAVFYNNIIPSNTNPLKIQCNFLLHKSLPIKVKGHYSKVFILQNINRLKICAKYNKTVQNTNIGIEG